jgi:2'-5' RNA ligase
MSLLVVAFTKIGDDDFNWIQEYRRKNDELYFSVIDPHFTLIFPVDAPLQQFVEEIESCAADLHQIEFEITKAVVNNDAFTEYCYEFLVPGKGYPQIVDLHDKLYEKNLQGYWRKDIEYIPHITIGNSKSYSKCLQAVNQLNSKQFSIAGTIDELSVVDHSANRVLTIKKIRLK